MKKTLYSLLVILLTTITSGCERSVDYKPEDFFEGSQLAIAQIIYDGNERELQAQIATLSKEQINSPAKAKMTLLYWAISNSFGDNATPERLKIISDLVRFGANPLQPQPNMSGSPAEVMLKADRDVWIKSLLSGGLSLNARDEIHHEPILFQTRYAKNTDTLNAMLDAGADIDIDIKDSLGQTLLMSAFISSSLDHVILLINRGANPNPININNLSMLTLVKRQINGSKKDSEYNNKCKEILSLLISHGAHD